MRPRSTAYMAATGTRGCSASSANSTHRTCSGSTTTSSPNSRGREPVRQLLTAAAAVLPGCGLMTLAITGTDTADGLCVTVTGNGSPVALGRAGADGDTVTDTPGFEC